MDALLPLIYLFPILVFVFLAIRIFSTYRRSQQAITMLEEGQLTNFMELVEAHLAKCETDRTQRPLRPYLLINKSAGLVLMGQWDEAIELLKTVRIPDRSKRFRQALCVNLLHALLMAERFDEARRLREEQAASFQLTGSRRTDDAIARVLAMYEYFVGDRETARSMLLDCLADDRGGPPRAICQYLLARIEMEKGDPGYRARLQEIVEENGESWATEAARAALAESGEG